MLVRESKIRAVAYAIVRTIALTLVALAVISSSQFLSAQNSGKSGRKIVQTIKPEYPEALKVAQIGGLVRLSATVQPNGSVTAVEIRGGNPILAERAQAAVMKWKYAPAPAQTVEEITLSFTPH